MSIALNSFILPDNIIESMKQKIEKTKVVHRELGFNLCQIEGSNELKDDIHCIGSECQIRLNSDCKIGKKVGLYHTHPDNISDPSLSDLQNGYRYGMNCVGGVEDNRIRCYVRKGDFNRKDYYTINYHRERFQSISAGKEHHITTKKTFEIIKAKMRERDYTRNKLRDSYFKIIDVI